MYNKFTISIKLCMRTVHILNFFKSKSEGLFRKNDERKENMTKKNKYAQNFSSFISD